MRLSAFNPASYLLGPVFQKEVRVAGRRRGTYIFRALYAAGLLTLVGKAVGQHAAIHVARKFQQDALGDRGIAGR